MQQLKKPEAEAQTLLANLWSHRKSYLHVLPRELVFSQVPGSLTYFEGLIYLLSFCLTSPTRCFP